MVTHLFRCASRCQLPAGLLAIVVILCLAASLAACASGGQDLRPGTDRAQSPAAFMAQQISELDSLPMPEGMDAAQWEELKTAMRSQLSGLKAVLAAPSTKASAAKLSLDEASLTLSWGYACQGDYDQNSEVNIADLAPIGTHFGKSTNGAGPFPPGSVESMVDGDSNGEINIADLSPIGTNFGRRVGKYNVYRTLSIDDLPVASDGPVGSGAELLGSVAHAAATGTPSQGQLQFSFVLENPAPGWFYFVRPADGNSEGTPSNVTSFGAKPDNLAPLASFTADPVSGDAPLSVSFDASASSDPDGANGDITDIVQFLWDFDGDGIVDETTTSPGTAHTYLLPGQFQATLVVFDAGAGSGDSSIAIGVGQAGNLPPTAAISADPTSGQAPLSIQFDASGSTDDGGAGNLTFEWDFNGDGTFDLSTGNVSAAQNNFTAGGQFAATVRVTDVGGLSATASVNLDITAPADNIPPVAELEVDKLQGDFPFTVTFNFDNSSDADGQIVLYEMDFEDDGTTDLSSPLPLGDFQHTYETAGLFRVVLTVTTDQGATASEDFTLRSKDPDNEGPEVNGNADPIEGDVPLLVTLDGSLSTDPDGTIVNYAWDVDGDFIFDISVPDPVTQFTYLDAGTFNVRLRVTDDDGASATGFLSTITVSDPANVQPVAQFTQTKTQSTFPVTYEFDASASTDPDGSIVEYLWDFDGSGEFEFSSGSNPVVTRAYPTKSSAFPGLQVIDNDGASDFADGDEVFIDVGFDLFDIGPLGGPDGITSSTVITHGLGGKQRNFAVAYAALNGSSQPKFSTTGSGVIDWSTPVSPIFANCTDSLSLIEGDDAPLLLIQKTSGGLVAVRATTVEGNSWGAEIPLDPRNCRTVSGAIIGGKPAVAYGAGGSINYKLADNSFGTSWPADPVIVAESQASSPAIGLLPVNGRPAVLFEPGSLFGTAYIRASDATGSSWPAGALLLDAGNGFTDGTYRMAIVSGAPAIAYTDGVFTEFQRGTDADGSDFTDPLPLEPVLTSGKFFNVVTRSSGPVVCYNTAFSPDSDLVVVFANDTAGTSWGDPLLVDILGDVGGGCSMCVAANKILISYVDSTQSRVKAAVLSP